jgi:hypothetical protein
MKVFDAFSNSFNLEETSGSFLNYLGILDGNKNFYSSAVYLLSIIIDGFSEDIAVLSTAELSLYAEYPVFLPLSVLKDVFLLSLDNPLEALPVAEYLLAAALFEYLSLNGDEL